MDFPEDLEIVEPKALQLEMALQLLAIFVRRFGGEVVVTQREFDMVEDLPLIARQVTPEHLRLRLVEECELEDDDDTITSRG